MISEESSNSRKRWLILTKDDCLSLIAFKNYNNLSHIHGNSSEQRPAKTQLHASQERRRRRRPGQKLTALEIWTKYYSYHHLEYQFIKKDGVVIKAERENVTKIMADMKKHTSYL